MFLLWLVACWDESTVIPPRGCRLSSDQKILTEDGATIALHHHPARGPAVLLVHGISCNHRIWDLDGTHSFADTLTEWGYDAWMVDLRGHGDAETDLKGLPQRLGWTVDDYGRHDLHAAVERVRAVTGQEKVALVGHSMGGMVAAIYMAIHGTEAVSSLVVLGSPGGFSAVEGDPLLSLTMAGMRVSGAMFRGINTRKLGDLVSGWEKGVPGKLDDRLYNPENIDGPTAAAMFASIPAPLSRQELQHFSRMLRGEHFNSYDGSIDYEAALKEVTVPAMVVAGEADHVVSFPWSWAYYDALGGPKRWLMAGKSQGFVADYGHLDLVLGNRVADELFPSIRGFLDNH